MALDRNLFIKLYLNRLVNSLVPSELGAEYTNSLVNDLVIQLSQPCTPPSLSKCMDEVKSLFLSQNRSNEWLRFRHIVDLLAQEKSEDQISNYLVFLSEFVPEHPPSSPHQLGFSGPPSFQNRLLSPSVNTSGINVPMAKLLESNADTLLEDQIIPYFQYTLLGQDTNLLKFLPNDSVDIPVNLDNTHARLISDILEPALIFRRLSRFLEELKGVAASPIKVSFYRCVESTLIAYTTYVNQMFQSSPPSLIAVLNSLQEQTRSLRLLLYLLRQSSSLTGYDFLVKVENLSKFGDLHVQKLATLIFNEIAVPYYEYLEQWIIRGELIDEHGDFFVSFNASENHINDIVKFDNKKLPDFLGMELSMFDRVLQIGKTLIFLSQFCKELEWVNSFSAKYSQVIFHANAGLKSMISSDIHNVVTSQHCEVMSFFTEVVQGKYLIYLHLVNLKSIMLMQQSDFVEVLSEKGAELLGEPATALSSGRISDLLMLSMEASTIHTLPPQYLNRIDARILDLSHGSIGWDVFTLEYKLNDLPIETLLNYDNAATQYLRLFHFLWSLRHYQYLLNDNYLEFQSLHKNSLQLLRRNDRGSNAWLLKAVRSINIVRSRLQTVLRVLLRYLSFDLVEECFRENVDKVLFKTSGATPSGVGLSLPILNRAFAAQFTPNSFSNTAHHNMNDCSIDDITTVHATYLIAISRCKLLNEDVKGRVSGRSLIDQIFDLLEIVFAFVTSSHEFGASAVNYINLVNVESNDLESDLDQVSQRLRSLVKIIYVDIYMGKFEPHMQVFQRDLRADMELKELSKLM